MPVKVWDSPVRLFHWALAALLVAQVVTGKIGGSAAMTWHLRGGCAILTLVLFRLVWGVIGSHYARFSSFVRGPAKVLRYARSLVRPPHDPHVGHNPLGGWMVLLMLALLLAQAVLGLYANDDIATDGPWAKFITKDLSDALSTWHRQLAWVIVGAAAMHVAAVLYYRVVLRQDVIGPMMTGVKRLPRGLAPEVRRTSIVLALVTLALAAALVWWLVVRL
ncbi:MAG: cytochrome b/b6 domain-containing protein [Casimicrobiaceae bacterium]